MRFPVDTVVRFNYLPTILAQLALTRNNSSVAIETLQAATPYELGQKNGSIMSALNPVYVRGEAYLAARPASEAAAEFKKLFDLAGIVSKRPNGRASVLDY